jgi:hypothetical protein
MTDRERGGDGADPPGDGDDEQSGPLSFEPDTPEAQARRWAHRRDPDLDSLPSEPSDAPPPPPRPGSQYGWLIAVVVALVLIYIGLNTLRNAGSVPRGPAANVALPPFAVPLALSRLDGDANVATRAGQGQRGARPACEVRGPDILNSCQLTEGAPAVLAFVAAREPACAAQLDRLERARGRFAAVRFAAVAVKTDRPQLRAQIRSRGWRFPIGYDRDGAVFARYGIVDCPTITFAYPGGVAMRTTVSPLSDAQLDAAVRRLVELSRRRGWKPPTPA